VVETVQDLPTDSFLTALNRWQACCKGTGLPPSGSEIPARAQKWV
jgi:hypothetical protein